MGGKGGGGGNYYQQPPDTTGLDTLANAEATLKNTAPLDMSGMQDNINVKKAARDATAKPAEDTSKPDPNALPTESTSGTSTTKDDTGALAAKAVLTPPGFWADYGKKTQADDPTMTTTQI
jgi:hypothetical protein